MPTPQYPDPQQPPDPSGYQPPDPSAYQPQAGQPGGYPPPDPNAYPPGQQGGYPPPDPHAYPPPGQQGGYPPPGTPGGPVMPGAPGEQPKKSNTPRIVMAVVIVAVVVLGIVLYFVNRGSDPDYAEVGDCIQYGSDTDVNVVDCTSSDAEYKVVKRVDGTSDQEACASVADSDVSLFTQSGNDKQYTLCVSLVLAEGDCMSTNGDKLACTDADAAIKVIKVLTGTTDDSGCPADTADSIVHQGDDQVLCLASNS
jgi:hypothetical protein